MIFLSFRILLGYRSNRSAVGCASLKPGEIRAYKGEHRQDHDGPGVQPQARLEEDQPDAEVDQRRALKLRSQVKATQSG
jgi:hypothetical protein